MVAPLQTFTSQELMQPELPPMNGVVDRALAGTEFRDVRSRDRLQALMSNERAERHGSLGPRFGPSVIFAQPPGDLPALLRLADQLDLLAGEDDGERALVWRCGDCNTRYAVPVALVREVSIRCERCGKNVELYAQTAIGEEHLVDPTRGTVNAARRELAVFFREAMARGWPVLVAEGLG